MLAFIGRQFHGGLQGVFTADVGDFAKCCAACDGRRRRVSTECQFQQVVDGVPIARAERGDWFGKVRWRFAFGPVPLHTSVVTPLICLENRARDRFITLLRCLQPQCVFFVFELNLRFVVQRFQLIFDVAVAAGIGCANLDGQIRTRHSQAVVAARVNFHVSRVRHVAINAHRAGRTRFVMMVRWNVVFTSGVLVTRSASLIAGVL